MRSQHATHSLSFQLPPAVLASSHAQRHNVNWAHNAGDVSVSTDRQRRCKLVIGPAMRAGPPYAHQPRANYNRTLDSVHTGVIPALPGEVLTPPGLAAH
jgi:hypothetical protein